MAQSPEKARRLWRQRKKNSNAADATQVMEESWYAVGHHDLHECCDCGLVHRVSYNWEDGRLWENWKRDERETRKARKLRDEL